MADSKLLKLPAELRNTIYELTFASRCHREVDFGTCNLHLPQEALLRVCHQTYREGLHFFNEANRLYWTSNTFTLVTSFVVNKQLNRQRMARLRCTDLQLISNFEVRLGSMFTGYTRTITMIDASGIWKETTVSTSENLWVMRPLSPRYFILSWDERIDSVHPWFLYCRAGDAKAKEIYESVPRTPPSIARQLDTIISMS